MITITEIMLKEHVKIDKMLEEFEKSFEINPEESKQIFENIKWFLEKHFFLEEKVIFHIYSSATEEESEEIISLLKDHRNMEWLMCKNDEYLKSNLNQVMSELKRILKTHVILEDKIFYPKLDEKLDEKDKDIILERAEEIMG